MWNNRNDLAIWQQFRADFRMIPDTFMDIVTLVRNRLEKQDTRFREAVSIEKRVAIAFRSSHQRCSMKKCVLGNFTKFTGNHLCQSLLFNKVAVLRPATILEKTLWHKCCPVNFAIFQSTFLQNTSGQLLLCFIAFSDWELLPQRCKSILLLENRLR